MPVHRVCVAAGVPVVLSAGGRGNIRVSEALVGHERENVLGTSASGRYASHRSGDTGFVPRENVRRVLRISCSLIETLGEKYLNVRSCGFAGAKNYGRNGLFRSGWMRGVSSFYRRVSCGKILELVFCSECEFCPVNQGNFHRKYCVK